MTSSSPLPEAQLLSKPLSMHGKRESDSKSSVLVERHFQRVSLKLRVMRIYTITDPHHGCATHTQQDNVCWTLSSQKESLARTHPSPLFHIFSHA